MHDDEQRPFNAWPTLCFASLAWIVVALAFWGFTRCAPAREVFGMRLSLLAFVAYLASGCSSPEDPRESIADILGSSTAMFLDSRSNVENWHEAEAIWTEAGEDLLLIEGDCDPGDWGCAGDWSGLANGEIGSGARQWPAARAVVYEKLAPAWHLAACIHALGHALGKEHTESGIMSGDYEETDRP